MNLHGCKFLSNAYVQLNVVEPDVFSQTQYRFVQNANFLLLLHRSLRLKHFYLQELKIVEEVLSTKSSDHAQNYAFYSATYAALTHYLLLLYMR